jgi:hypothetical protein
MTPPPHHLHQCLRVDILFSKRHIYARIIAFCAYHIVSETLAIVFKRELLGFLHVGRLEHHAIAPVARLPK